MCFNKKKKTKYDLFISFAVYFCNSIMNKFGLVKPTLTY